MGVSTDGILWYGYHFEEGTEFPWDDEEHPQFPYFEEDWERFVAFKRGLVIDFEAAGYDYGKISDLIKSLPVTIGTHCSDEVPMYYLAIKTSEVQAARGYPKEVYPESMTLDTGGSQESWDDQLIAFAEEFGLPKPGNSGASEIGWWLASYWG